MSKFMWCVLGRSGSGKDTLLESLMKNYFPGRTKVISKTTRLRRSVMEDCHIFTTEKELQADRAAGQVVAYNKYAGNHYWATAEQIDNADFYIVDVPGLIQLKRDYAGNKTIKAIGLDISAGTSLERMLKRGDSLEKAQERLSIDEAAFSRLRDVTDVCLTTDTLTKEETAQIISDFIKVFEKLGN